MTSIGNEKAAPEVCEKDLSVIAMADLSPSRRTPVDAMIMISGRKPDESAPCSIQILKKRSGRSSNVPVIFDEDFSMAMRRFRDENDES